jgi:hypothetical protein
MWQCATCSRWTEGIRALRRDEGSSLLLVLLVVPVVTALAGVLVLATTTETLTASRHQQSLLVRYAARALAERVVADLRGQADWSRVLSGTSTSAFSETGTTWQADGDSSVDLGVRGAALQAATNAEVARGADTPRWRLYAWGPLSRLVTPVALPDLPAFVGAWVADDGEDGDGDPSADSNGMVTIRVEAFGRGHARWAVTALVARGTRGLEDVWRLSWKDEP